MEYIVIILLGVILILSYKYYTMTKHLNKCISILKDIKSGNFNRKFLMNGNKLIAEMCAMLNSLFEDYRKLLNRKNYLEQLRFTMISDISHDIRTPLTSLLGYVEALRTDAALTEEERMSYLEVIGIKGTALYTMMDEFFELTKLDENQEIELTRIEITEKVRQVLVTFYHNFVNEEITPKIILPYEPVFALGDEKSIERVLSNLVSNALRYGKDGEVVGIEVKKIKGNVQIEVWDMGCGIPAKDLMLVFERLYTTETSRNETYRGSGLGLSIAKKLVERMKGEITATSKPFEKTTFTVTLKGVD